MGRNLVVFSDGTGNAAGSPDKTNVWRLAQALSAGGPQQLAMYIDGVGTSSVKFLALIGAAFGWGLKRNVLDLYKFLCRNHSTGDRIYGFGFSRGAFTIRVLVGLISTVGLVTFGSEEELDRNAAAAYRHYRSQCFRSWSPFVLIGRAVRDLALFLRSSLFGGTRWGALEASIASAGRRDVEIHFLGLWDTVDAYGVPLQELKLGIHWVLWPMLFGDLKLSPKVRKACHALALDDERTTFHPLVWDEVAESQLRVTNKVASGRLQQVWFAGMHANVGGGYPEDNLALVSLDWIIQQAIENDLLVDAQAHSAIRAAMSPFARIHDSRAGLASYYRYGPRRIFVRRGADGDIRPVVHHSVPRRMSFGGDRYAPISLPYEFDVLIPSGERLKMDGAPLRGRAATRVGEVEDEATSEVPIDLQGAIARFSGVADRLFVQLVWDTVFWRRVAYFFTVVATVALLVFPFVGERSIDWLKGATEAIPWAGKTIYAQWEFLGRLLAAPVGNLMELLSAFVPSYARPWQQALLEHPSEFLAMVVAVLVGMTVGTRLQQRIRDRARAAWHCDFRSAFEAAWGEAREARRRRIRVLALFAGLGWGASLMIPSASLGLRAELGGLFVLLALFVLTPLAIERTAMGRSARERSRTGSAATTLAGWIDRGSGKPVRWIRKGYEIATGKVVPLVFGVAAALVVTLVAHHAALEFFVSLGAVCSNESNSSEFETKSICWRVPGQMLEKGKRYRITITIVRPWLDDAHPSGVGGFPANNALFVLATPLKRIWRANYFQPIARIGVDGFDEYILDPAEPPGDDKELTAEIQARSSGPLFLYVNDALLAWQWRGSRFYLNNHGTAKVSVKPL